jgi:RND family efflux transporter MFP subunit
MKVNSQYFFRLLSVFAILLALQACSGGGGESQQKSQGAGQRGQRGQRGGRGAGEAVLIKSTTPQRIAIQRIVDLSGSLVSPDQVRVSSEVDGIVASVNAELGQEVRAGEILIQIDTRELELAVERAESALRQTEAQLGVDSARPGVVPPDEQIASVRTAIANREDAKVKLAQTQELVNKGLAARSDLDTNDTRLKVAEAAVQFALENIRALKASMQDRRASYELAKKKLTDASIRSPSSGTIAERLVQKGEYIRANTQVATIVQLNPLKLQTAVQEKFANIIRRNLLVNFRVEPFPDDVFEGRVLNISPSVNQQTRTFPVEILVANPTGKLKPGFFAKGAILTQKDQNVLAVPQEAVSTLAGVSSVFVIEDGAVRQQNVALGAQQGNFVEIMDGLKGNEILAASSLNEITTGMKVTLTDSPGAPPAERTEQASEAAPAPKVPQSPDVQRGNGARRGFGGND